MTAEVLLQRLIEKYERMPDTVFPFHLGYSDTGYAGRQKVSVRVGAPEDPAAQAHAPLSASGTAPRATTVGVSIYEQPGREGKTCALSTGREIAARLTELLTALGAYKFAPPGRAARESPAPYFELVAVAAKDSRTSASSCPRADTCPVAEHCVTVRKDLSLSGLRYDSGRVLDVRALQALLFMLGYGDEMCFEHYGTDGRFGVRTRLALEAFVREHAFAETRALPAERVDRVDSATAARLVACCKAGWRRPHYSVLEHESWDLAPDMPADELSWLARRYHVRCLQDDLVALRIATLHRSGSAHVPVLEPMLERQWCSGFFDAATASAVRLFQDAARLGGRFNPVTRAIDYDLRRASFRGDATGGADRATRVELGRWLADLSTGDAQPQPFIEEVLSPALGCPALLKQEGTFELVFSVLRERGASDAEVAQELADALTLHVPRTPATPFGSAACPPSGAPAGRPIVLRVERIEDPEAAGLYGGTAETTPIATCIDSPREAWLDAAPDSSRETTAARVTALYDRGYQGPADGGRRALFRAVLRLDASVGAGLYLLHVRGYGRRHPLPVRVFERERSEYRVAHISDLCVSARHDELEAYLGTAGYQNPNQSVRRLIARLNAEQPDWIVITGNLVESAHKHRATTVYDGALAFSPEDFDANWRAFHAMVTCAPGLSVPFFTVLGDRDRAHNPPGVALCAVHLGLSRADAALYPLDREDTLDAASGFPEAWRTHTARADTFYADENAAEFYYRNINPFVRSSFALDELAFCFVDSGRSRIDSVQAFGDQTPERSRERLERVFQEGLACEACTGISEDASGWLASLAASGKRLVLSMHAPPFSFPISDIELSTTSAGDAQPLDLEAALVAERGVQTAPGWGSRDLLEQQGWYAPDAAARHASQVAPAPRDWIPLAAADRAMLEDKQRIVAALVGFLRPLPHPPAPCAAECVAPAPEHAGEGYRLPQGQCPARLVTELARLDATLAQLLAAGAAHAGLLAGMQPLLALLEAGSVPLVLTGHLRRYRLMTCTAADGRTYWRMPSSKGETVSASAAGEPTCRILSTLSCGYAGSSYVPAAGSVALASGAKGFIELVLSRDGTLRRWSAHRL